MDDKKTLELILKFGLQEDAKIKKAAREMSGVTDEWKRLQREAANSRKAIEIALEHGEDTRKLENNLERVETALKQVAMQAAIAQRNMQIQASQNLKQLGGDLQQIGQSLAVVGAGMLAGPLAAAKNFIDNVPFDDVTARWQSSQHDIEQSYLRIGAVAAETLLPLVEKLAGLAEQTAEFVEQNPEVIKALVGLGSFLAVGGGALQIGGKLAEMGGLAMQYAPGLGGAIKGGLATAGKAVGGFLGGVGGAVTGGLALGGVGYEALARSETGQRAGLANLGQYASVAAYGAGSLFGQGDEWFRWMGEMTGVIEKQAEAAEKNVKTQEIVTQKQLDAFAAYEDAQKQRQEYENSAEEQRNQLIQEFADRRKEIEANAESQRNQVIAQFASQRANLMRQFSQTEQRTEQDYYRQRAQAAQKHGLDVQRAEQDHQRELRKLQRDHNRRVTDLVDERDALGLVREQRSYEDQRQETEQNHRIEMQRRNEDYALQLRDMEANFALQRQRRLEDYQRQVEDLRLQEQQRLAQMEAQKAIELQKLEELEKQKLEQFDKNHKAELEQLRAAEQNRLAILRSVALNDNSLLQKAGMEMTARYRAWLQQAAQNFLTPVSAANFGSRPPQYRAAGGWVNSASPYIVGERGPELFVPHNAGTIVPNHQMMSNRERTSAAGAGEGLNMRIETSSLTLSQVIREIDKRLGKNNRALAGAFGG